MVNGNGKEELSVKKKEIRKEMLLRREALTEEQRREAAVLLTERILGHQWFYRSDILLGFAAYGSEIETEEILQEALRRGKRVYLPRVLTSQEDRQTTPKEIISGQGHKLQRVRRMEFYRIRCLAELQPGYHSIPEPSCCGEQYVYRAGDVGRVLMLMPGVAFDPYRNRLGYGGGFYDRYLSDKEELQTRTIGVGFRCQMTDLLPVEKSDVKPYQIICV